MHPDSSRNAPVAPARPAMRRAPGSVAAVLLALLGALGLSGCAEDTPDTGPGSEPQAGEPAPETPKDADGAEPGDGDGDASLGELARERDRRGEALRREMDEKARGLIGSFRARVYDPLRDAGLVRLRGTATFRSGEIVATYSVAFDGTEDEDGQVTVEKEAVPAATPRGTERQIVRFANHSLRGGYQSVVNYYPPVQMLYTSTRDNARIVTAQPWKHDVQVSYRIDERDLVHARGANAPRGQEVVEFTWSFYRGRYLLEQMTFKGTGSTIEYEYDEWAGVVLLREATIVRGASTMVTTFEYEAIEKGEPKTPLVPTLSGRPPGADESGDDDSGGDESGSDPAPDRDTDGGNAERRR